MSGPLHVTHLMVLAQSDANKSAEEDDKDEATSNVNLRITRLPRGPSLGFKILRYALARDVLAATKRPRSPGKEFATEPMVRKSYLHLSFRDISY
jgi:ribosome biogenesis protein SSF1/2